MQTQRHKHRLAGAQLRTAYRHICVLQPLLQPLGRAVTKVDVTADCCNRPPHHHHLPYCFLQRMQKNKEGNLSSLRGIFEVRFGSYEINELWFFLTHVNPYMKFVCMPIRKRRGGAIGGLENARNVEGCNQNVLLFEEQQQKGEQKEHSSC